MVTMTKGNILIDPTLYVQTIETTSKNQLRTLYYLPSRDRWTLSVPAKIYRETDWYWLCIIDRRFHPVQGTTPRHMPMLLNVKRLGDGDDIGATLMRHSAQWHNTCRLKFSKNVLQQSRAGSSWEQQSSYSTQTVRTLSADQRRQQSIYVSFVMSQLALLTCTMQLQNNLTRTSGDMPLSRGILISTISH